MPHMRNVSCNMLRDISITIVAFFIEMHGDKSHDYFIHKEKVLK